jgi:hypothetical protein
MSLTSNIQTNWTSGELTPRMLGRIDLSKYYNGAQLIKNFITQIHGGAIRRSGTRFITNVKTQSSLTRLIPFQYNVAQTYMLEFGAGYIRFYRDNGQLTFAGVPTEITSPYTEAQLRDLKFIQSADVLTICHPSIQPRQLSRTAGDDANPATWTLAKHQPTDGPYIDLNTTAITITPSATTGNITLTASAALWVSTDAPSANNNGRLVRLQDPGAGSDWGVARITGYTSSTVVNATVIVTLLSTVATVDWRLGAWSDTTGWPSCSAYHQDRQWYANTTNQPQTIWGSKIGNYNNFATSNRNADTVTDEVGLAFTIADEQVNSIHWLISDAHGLVVLTEGGEYVTSSGDNGTITALDFGIKRQGNEGASRNIRPWKVGSAILFTHNADREVRELVFRFDQDQYVAPNMTLLSEHVTKPVGTATLGNGVVDSAYQQKPHNILWLVRGDGVLIGMTYERNEEVVAWHQHQIGGSFGTGNAQVESIAVIRESGVDQLWMIVKRTINGATKRYIEIMQPLFDVGDAVEDAFFVDSGLTYDGTPTKTFTGLSHLEGETVQVLADGARQDDMVVNGGVLNLSREYSTVHAGLGFTSRLKTMPVVPASLANERGKKKHVYQLTMMLHNTVGGTIAFDDGLADPILYRDQAYLMDVRLDLFTGMKAMPMPGGPDRQSVISIQTDDPLPMNVLCLIMELAVDGV